MISSLARRLRFLFGHPGFRAEPFAVLGRGVGFAGHLLLRRPLTFPLSRGGERLQVPPSLRYTSSATFLLRDWCEPELRRLDSLLRPGAVFLDVGANIGLYTLRAATLVGDSGRVVAVEPSREALAALRVNLTLNPALAPRVTVVEAALSDVDGAGRLYHVAAGHDPQSFSLLADGTAQESEPVTVETLDGLVERLGLARLDLVKLDVEGAEPLVLAGAARTLEQLRPSFIIEMNSAILSRAEVVGDAAWRRLDEAGYAFFRLLNGRLESITQPPREFCNVVAQPR